MYFPILQDNFILSWAGARLVYVHWTLAEYGIPDQARLAQLWQHPP